MIFVQNLHTVTRRHANSRNGDDTNDEPSVRVGTGSQHNHEDRHETGVRYSYEAFPEKLGQ
jgi:hypothetical protein